MSRVSRREFVVLGAAGLALPWRARVVAPSDRVRVGVAGVRGQGGSLLKTFAAQPDVEVVYICDVDESVRSERGAELARATGKPARLVTDYRAVLDDRSVDALVIGTPDHWHALLAIHACLAGKDVYVEKPDGHNILEGRAMVAAARKHGRMMQLGTQARSAPDLFEAVAYVRAGNLGKVIYGRAWETDAQSPIGRPADSAPPPGVDYDRWLGPAPARPFNRARFHGSWRWFFDYGTGDLGNDGVHRMDFCRWVMGIGGLEYPTAISASGGKFFFDDAQEWPDTQLVTYEYPGRLLTYEMRIWSKPRLFGESEGAAIHGTEGWMVVSNLGWKHFDAKGTLVKEGTRLGSHFDARRQVVRELLPRSPLALHVRNFLDAVKSRKRESLHQEIEQGHVSSVMCHAGNVAWRTGKKLRFDPKSHTFDDREANRYLGRSYRKGYELPAV